MHPKKGLHLLLHALGNLDRTLHHHARLVVVGGGKKEYLRKLQGLVEREKERLPRVDCVRETWGDDKWTYFQGADSVLPAIILGKLWARRARGASGWDPCPDHKPNTMACYSLLESRLARRTKRRLG